VLCAVVVADLRVVELVATEDETVRANVAHQREHRQKGGLIVLREMQVMRRDPALDFELRHGSRLLAGKKLRGMEGAGGSFRPPGQGAVEVARSVWTECQASSEPRPC
jgi:hypothetical protein